MARKGGDRELVIEDTKLESGDRKIGSLAVTKSLLLWNNQESGWGREIGRGDRKTKAVTMGGRGREIGSGDRKTMPVTMGG